MSRVGTHVRWLSLVLAACSMGKEPPPRPPPPALGTVNGHVTFEMHGPGADDGRAAYTEVSHIACTVRVGSVTAATGSDGAYTLRVPAGQAEVSFADCAKHCCYNPPSTLAAEVRAGSATVVDFSCDCDAK